MDAGTLIAEVAKRDGILLDRNDPVIVVATAVDVAMEKRCQEMDAIVTRFEAAVAAAKPGLSEAQFTAMTRNVGSRLVREQSYFRQAFNWRTLALSGGILLVSLILGVAIGWRLYAYENSTILSWGRAAMSQCNSVAPGALCHPAIKVGQAPS